MHKIILLLSKIIHFSCRMLIFKLQNFDNRERYRIIWHPLRIMVFIYYENSCIFQKIIDILGK